MNHENYQQRMDFVKSILEHNGLQAKHIEPVEYEENAPFPYNNYIYLVTLASPTTTAINVATLISGESQPGTVSLPANSTSVIMRLANADPRTGVNNTNRVENEVAATVLTQQALANTKYSHIVPDVYAWSGMSTGQGFSMQKYMPGTMPHREFDNMSLQDQSAVLGQMADILTLLQQFEIPKTVERLGGLSFGKDGSIISAEMTMFKGEPCISYKDLIRTMFRVKLQEADDNPVMQATNNLLFNATTLQVTALLDFDFSFVGTVADEFMGFSFANIPGGHLPGPFNNTSELSLRKAMLNGFSNPLASIDHADVSWELAQAWDKELARAGAARPGTIPQFEDIADIYDLQDKTSPFELDNPMMRKRMTADELQAVRDETESLIVKFLNRFSV